MVQIYRHILPYVGVEYPIKKHPLAQRGGQEDVEHTQLCLKERM